MILAGFIFFCITGFCGYVIHRLIKMRCDEVGIFLFGLMSLLILMMFGAGILSSFGG